MRLSILLSSLLVLVIPSLLGCGDNTGAVADEESLDEYLQENPEVMIDEEEEEALMEADAAVQD